MVRSDQHASLPLKEFLVVFNEGWSFIIKCEVMARKMIVGLRGVMMSQVLAQLDCMKYHLSRWLFFFCQKFISFLCFILRLEFFGFLTTDHVCFSLNHRQRPFCSHFITHDFLHLRPSLRMSNGLKSRFQHRLSVGPTFWLKVRSAIHPTSYFTRLQRRSHPTVMVLSAPPFPGRGRLRVLPVPLVVWLRVGNLF